MEGKPKGDGTCFSFFLEALLNPDPAAFEGFSRSILGLSLQNIDQEKMMSLQWLSRRPFD